jgi:hypothetical protein
MNESLNITSITGNDEIYYDPENEYAVVNSVQLKSGEAKILLLQDLTRVEEFSESRMFLTLYPIPASDELVLRFNHPVPGMSGSEAF